jgi:hypothetical protein
MTVELGHIYIYTHICIYIDHPPSAKISSAGQAWYDSQGGNGGRRNQGMSISNGAIIAHDSGIRVYIYPYIDEIKKFLQGFL